VGISVKHLNGDVACASVQMLQYASLDRINRSATAGDLPILRLGRRIYVPTARLLALLGLIPEDSR
jgi:hypothetical protein